MTARGRIGAAAALVVAAVMAVGPASAVDRTGVPGAGARAEAAPTARVAAPAAVPILMYHQIAAPPRGRRNTSLYVPPALFAEHVRALAKAGYTAVTLRQAWDHWHTGRQLPARPVVLSFDDGYRSQYTDALPVLKRRRWPGVLNLTTGTLRGYPRLHRVHVRRMIAAGWQLDAHTVSHPDLTKVDDATLAEEVAGSRAAIRERFGVTAEFFCYPYGRFDARVVEAVRQAGFLGATTTRPGLASADDDAFALDRVKAGGDMTGAGLVRALRRREAAER